MPRQLILTVGLPRSGKTTWARSTGWPVVSPDAIRTALHGQPFFEPAEKFVWALANLMVEALFAAGHDQVIVDACHVTKKRRDEWMEKYPDATFVTVETPPAECIRRAKAGGREDLVPVIHRMAEAWDLQRPSSWGPAV